MFSQFQFQQAVKRLSEPNDGSDADRASKEKARKYLIAHTDHMIEFADKNPSSRVAVLLYHEAVKVLNFVISTRS